MIARFFKRINFEQQMWSSEVARPRSGIQVANPLEHLFDVRLSTDWVPMVAKTFLHLLEVRLSTYWVPMVAKTFLHLFEVWLSTYWVPVGNILCPVAFQFGQRFKDQNFSPVVSSSRSGIVHSLIRCLERGIKIMQHSPVMVLQ